jgi:CRISPR-associated protein Cas1
MLTLPDLKAKQILFIQTEQGIKNHLFFKNENLIFEKNGEIINQASCHRILAIFIIGDFSLTSCLIRECRRRAASLFFLGRNFKTYASINSTAEGNYLLRSKQYNIKPDCELRISKEIVENKIQNQIKLLQGADKLSNKQQFDKIIRGIKLAKSAEELLGLEGNFSKIFFKEYFSEMGWFRRAPRTKEDIQNLLLDMGYAFLFNFIDSLLLLFGFDTYKGYYHKLFFQRKSLTCDIIEPFRSIIEKSLLKAYHLSQINEKDFFVKNGRYSLSYDKNQKYVKIFMDAIMDHKQPLYLYVQNFYRFIMKDYGRFPVFDIITKQVK